MACSGPCPGTGRPRTKRGRGGARRPRLRESRWRVSATALGLRRSNSRFAVARRQFDLRCNNRVNRSRRHSTRQSFHSDRAGTPVHRTALRSAVPHPPLHPPEVAGRTCRSRGQIEARIRIRILPPVAAIRRVPPRPSRGSPRHRPASDSRGRSRIAAVSLAPRKPLRVPMRKTGARHDRCPTGRPTRRFHQCRGRASARTPRGNRRRYTRPGDEQFVPGVLAIAVVVAPSSKGVPVVTSWHEGCGGLASRFDRANSLAALRFAPAAGESGRERFERSEIAGALVELAARTMTDAGPGLLHFPAKRGIVLAGTRIGRGR